MRAVIVGAGIGGLAAAVGLRRAGWEVTVLERALKLGEIGAGITLWSNALRALAELDLGEEIRAHGTTQAHGGMRTPRGRWLSRSSGAEVASRDGLTLLTVHRARLHASLATAAPPVTLGAEVHDIDQQTVRYTDAAGEHTVAADLIVGADGIRSRVRTLLYPEAQPRYTGFTAWRGVTDEPFTLLTQSETLGRGAEFGLVQLIDGRVYWFGTANEPESVDGREASPPLAATGEGRAVTAVDEHTEVLNRFGGWHAPIADVVRNTAPAAVLRHDVYQLPRPLRPFAAGRVALLGDAAHAFTPNLGQGACQALEDAVTLAAEVAPLTDPDGVPAALARYDLARRPRTEAISRASDQVHRIMQARGRVGVALRTAVIAATPATLATARLARMFAWTPPEIRR